MPGLTLAQFYKLSQFRTRLPLIAEWVDDVTEKRGRDARLLGEMAFARIPAYVSDETLARVRVVVTDEPPRPPMKEFGFKGVDAQLDGMAFGELEMRGATLDQLFFISPRAVADEQFPFHQIVHSLQWRALGREAWLTSYGMGVLLCGRANTWAEQQAGRLQASFARGEVFDAEQVVRAEAELLRAQTQTGLTMHRQLR